MASLLTLQNFSLHFTSTTSSSFALNNISFAVAPGETHALVGESGSGKSITALSILRLLEDVAAVESSGTILFDQKQINTLSREEIQALRGNDIAMIFQEPMTSLNPVYTIGNQLIEPLIRHQGASKNDARSEAISLLDRTGIKDPEYRIDQYPHQLSGGQRQRVMIAMALACRPKLLIADEPTTALDITIQGQILDLLKDLQQEFGMAILLITHDLTMVKQRADTVSIMYQGQIVEQGEAAAIFHHPEEEYTRHLLKSIPAGIRTSTQPTEPIVELKNINCTFLLQSRWVGFLRRKKTYLTAVDDITLTIQQHKTLGIVGESGSGKSTLAMCLLGLTKFNGQVVYHQGDEKVVLSTLSPRQFRKYRRDLQIVFQDPFSSLSPRMSVEQIVGEGLQVHSIGSSKKERRKLIMEALADVELEPESIYRFPHEFSGGQRQRIAIARALILRPKLLVLDEPTSALDMTIQRQILDLLQSLQERYGMTYIFISHDLRTIRAMADEVVVMQRGKIVESGQTAELFAHPREEYTKTLFKAAFY